MATLVKPHGGGELKPLLRRPDELSAECSRAKNLPRVEISSRETGDLVMLGIGGFTPLDGFMSRADWQSTAALGTISLSVAPNGLGKAGVQSQRRLLIQAADHHNVGRSNYSIMIPMGVPAGLDPGTFLAAFTPD